MTSHNSFDENPMQLQTQLIHTVDGAEKLVEAPLGHIARRVLELSPTCARIFGR